MKTKLSVRWIELGVILVIAVAIVLVFLPSLNRAREAAHRASCQNNLRQIGLICKMYANESPGERWPPVSRIPNNWIFDIQRLHPEYLTDLQLLECPESPFADAVSWSRPQCVTSLFYNYTGWLLHNDEQAMALFDYYYERPDRVIVESELKLNVPIWKNTDVSRHDRGGSMAVVWDRVPLTDREFPHDHRTINVLIMDGHVESVPYSYYNRSSNFPVTRIGAETFGSVLPTPFPECVN
jgi:hypothetical protein